jgi:UDP-N-acetylglucosamine 1-carboxyvinyltransferase
MAQTAVTDVLSESFVIQGGRPLNGRIRAAGNKNAALPNLAACLLTTEPVVLHNVPRIRDVETMMALIAGLGAEVGGSARTRSASTRPTSRRTSTTPSCRPNRASFLLAGRCSRGSGGTSHRRAAM